MASDGSGTGVSITLTAYNSFDGARDGIHPSTAAPALLTDFIYQTQLGPNGPPGTFTATANHR